MRWSMVPVSVMAHAFALAALVIVPAAAEVDLPTPWPLAGVRDYVAAIPVPPAEPSPRPKIGPSNSDAAPIAAPPGIEPEVPRAGPEPETPGGVPDGPGVTTGVPFGLSDTAPVAVSLPPPPAQAPTVVRPGGAIREPRKIVHVPAVYPEVARAARIEGLVIIEATLDERGTVIDARVLRSQPLLDGAALTALRQWRYTPTLLNGVPVRVLMTVTFNFTLGDRAR